MADTGPGPAGRQRVGLIGLGVMGSAISSMLIAEGAEVWGYDIARPAGSSCGRVAAELAGRLQTSPGAAWSC